MNPYEILGIDKTATRDEIDAAYRKKAIKYHPDAGGDAWVFKQVREAYDALTEGIPGTERARSQSDTASRASYGQATQSGRQRQGSATEGGQQAAGESRQRARARTAEQTVDQGETPPPSETRTAWESPVPPRTQPSPPRWWSNLLVKVVYVLMLALGAYFVWDSYDFLYVAETTQGCLTSEPKESFSRRGHYQVSIDYSFRVNGCDYNGKDSLSDAEARRFSQRLSDSGFRSKHERSMLEAFGVKVPPDVPPRLQLTVFYDRNNPNRNRASLPDPSSYWIILAAGLVGCFVFFPSLQRVVASFYKRCRRKMP